MSFQIQSKFIIGQSYLFNVSNSKCYKQSLRLYMSYLPFNKYILVLMDKIKIKIDTLTILMIINISIITNNCNIIIIINSLTIYYLL